MSETISDRQYRKYYMWFCVIMCDNIVNIILIGCLEACWKAYPKTVFWKALGWFKDWLLLLLVLCLLKQVLGLIMYDGVTQLIVGPLLSTVHRTNRQPSYSPASSVYRFSSFFFPFTFFLQCSSESTLSTYPIHFICLLFIVSISLWLKSRPKID